MKDIRSIFSIVASSLLIVSINLGAAERDKTNHVFSLQNSYNPLASSPRLLDSRVMTARIRMAPNPTKRQKKRKKEKPTSSIITEKINQPSETIFGPNNGTGIAPENEDAVENETVEQPPTSNYDDSNFADAKNTKETEIFTTDYNVDNDDGKTIKDETSIKLEETATLNVSHDDGKAIPDADGDVSDDDSDNDIYAAFRRRQPSSDSDSDIDEETKAAVQHYTGTWLFGDATITNGLRWSRETTISDTDRTTAKKAMTDALRTLLAKNQAGLEQYNADESTTQAQLKQTESIVSHLQLLEITDRRFEAARYIIKNQSQTQLDEVDLQCFHNACKNQEKEWIECLAGSFALGLHEMKRLNLMCHRTYKKSLKAKDIGYEKQDLSSEVIFNQLRAQVEPEKKASYEIE